ncbi:MAG: hypothetical protein RR413_07460, partial [Christensenellaceae bacterium]
YQIRTIRFSNRIFPHGCVSGALVRVWYALSTLRKKSQRCLDIGWYTDAIAFKIAFFAQKS